MGCGVVNTAPSSLAVIEVGIVNAVLPAEGLQFTFAGTYAGEAGPVVIREEKLKIDLSIVGNELTVGHDVHAVGCREYTSSCEFRRAVDLDKAHTTCADAVIDIFQIAECRNTDSGDMGCLENSGALRCGDLDAINGQGDGFFIVSQNNSSLLRLGDRIKLTYGLAGSTLDAGSRVNDKARALVAFRCVLRDGDCIGRAVTHTHGTAHALLTVDGVDKKVGADARRAMLVHNVSNILVTEIFQG